MRPCIHAALLAFVPSSDLDPLFKNGFDSAN